MAAKPWKSHEKNLISRTAYALRKGKRSSQYSAVKFLQRMLPKRSWESIRSKLRRNMGLIA